MYKYEYERIKIEFSGWGLLGGNAWGTEEHKAVIDKRASDGWRYVGFIPAVQRGSSQIQEMDLVFEKEE